MQLATVLGQVVATVKEPKLGLFTLLLVQDAVDADVTQPGGAVYVAVDQSGAGTGEVVLVARGGAARAAVGPDVPTDRAVVAIVDSVVRAGEVTYQKA
ncbi:EutN/CcmL family microcompartment protein [Amycolatopsis rubida]|uniref:Ethanolamine utilization protein EutN n=1 Tax=Amycolatopsis rubida TaxID=112413 RepID=A0A1I5VG12_9PSEU|nr:MULTISPECIES: EutN/CcmL family microcompartment protein [Amycolatopsis]MYW89332.1 ethanolamine utilization protein EutN [Amycolatopsis rubida]NEC54310.1 EutN/CcmL family microcompartment protein [Amycolatopsis rubida]OAP21081.1 Ethanolamine utilization protein EutN [Amycolatopsis sp. M39]SFQ06488.1 ethanolamine utilization protein EutN [Amycolatopsis rubida]